MRKFLPLLAILLFSGLYVYSSNLPYNQLYHHNIEMLEGDPFLYDGYNELVLNRFDIDGMEFKSVIVFSFVHSPDTLQTTIYFFVALLPSEPYQLDDELPEFWGNLTKFSFHINEQLIDLEPRRSHSILSINNKEYYNIVMEEYYYDYIEEEYAIKTFNFDIAFQFALFSNHSRFSSDNIEIQIGTSKEAAYSTQISSVHPIIAKNVPWISLLIAIVSLAGLLWKGKHFDHTSPNAIRDLKYITIILPHLFVFFPFMFMADFSSGFIIGNFILGEYLIIFFIYFLIPVIIEISARNYVYQGVTTLTEPLKNNILTKAYTGIIDEPIEGIGEILENENRNIKLQINDFPNTMRIETNMLKTDRTLKEGTQKKLLLKHYERRLFTSIIMRTLITTSIISIIGLLGPGPFLLFVGIFYNIWVFYRKI